jgi:hypothetical protein
LALLCMFTSLPSVSRGRVRVSCRVRACLCTVPCESSLVTVCVCARVLAPVRFQQLSSQVLCHVLCYSLGIGITII